MNYRTKIRIAAALLAAFALVFTPASANNIDTAAQQGQSTHTNDLGITNGNITILAWVAVDTLPALNNGNAFAWKGDAGTNLSYRMGVENAGGTHRLFFYRTREGVANDGVTYNYTATLGEWMYVAMTYDGTNVTGFLNASSVGQSAASGNGTSGGFDGLKVLRHLTEGTNATDLKIAHLAIFRSALTAAEVQNYMWRRPADNTPNLVALYRFDQGVASSTPNLASSTSGQTLGLTFNTVWDKLSPPTAWK